jgi:hypothetical protein
MQAQRPMHPILFYAITLLFLLEAAALHAFAQTAPPERLRVFVLTDIENEPDDAMSMVRFLVYCNEWDVEGLIATTSVHQRNKTAAWRIREIVEAYGKVRANLLIHEPGYPTTNHLFSIIKEGLPAYGMEAVGQGHDSSASELLIAAVDRADSRPLWIPVWGGPNVLAQALWKVRATRTAAQLEKFVSKLRVYTISDQDDSGPWIRKNFTNLFYIASPGFHSLGGYHHATWTGISGDNFHGRFAGADFSIVDNPWLDEHIRSKGPLGRQYPHVTFLMEGDTPTFLYLVNNGLNNPEHPDWGGWGGRYEFHTPPFRKWHQEPETRPLWADAQDEVFGNDGKWHTGNKETIWRWRVAYQNDFEARMIWSITTNYAGANHPPVAKLAHGNHLVAKPGETIKLSAEGSSDPDGNTLSYQWTYYPEAGTFTISTATTGLPLKIENSDRINASFTVPGRFGRPGSIHIILAVTDHGKPALIRYQRVIVDVKL